MGHINMRVDQAAIDYRKALAKKTGRKLHIIDQEIIDFYIKHHPLLADTNDTNDTERKETT